MVEKVRLQDRITSEHLKKILRGQGIDPDYEELIQNYAPRSRGKEHTPYAQFYRDRISGSRTMMVSILPHITNAGFFIAPRWHSVGSKFVSEENCFTAEVKDGTIRVACASDQPNGRKQGDYAEWHPQVFLDGTEQHCGSPVWLETDPINSGYNYNTLEWDYGFCKRRARIVEGRFRDRIFITSDPHREVKVANNVTGNMRLKFGSKDGNGMPIGKASGDIEIISKEEFAEAKYPITIGASPETFYPDADAENTCVDGRAWHYVEAGAIWGDIRDGAGNGSNDSEVKNSIAITCDDEDSKYRQIVRGIYLFDTSGLPNSILVTATVLSIYGASKFNDAGWSPVLNIYASTPDSNIAIINGDFTQVGTTAFATGIAYAALDVADYNDFTFNATGRAAVSKTSISKFGTRESDYDVADSAPAWGDVKYWLFESYFADQGNTTNDPKLVVTYSMLPVQAASMAAKLMSRGLI